MLLDLGRLTEPLPRLSLRCLDIEFLSLPHGLEGGE